MLRRPTPTDSEQDLLREQDSFLKSGAPCAASVVRRPDKRRGQGGGHQAQELDVETESNQRDVVTIEDLPDDLPSLTPAPAKKSRFKGSRVTFQDEDEDAEETLDRLDTHITGVLSRIIERDTSSAPVSFPAFTNIAFPKVFHRSEANVQVSGPSAGGKKSLFARQMEAQRMTAKQPLTCGDATPVILQGHNFYSEKNLQPVLVSGQGHLGVDGSGEISRIHQENQAKLQAMSPVQILEEQRKLLTQLDPQLVEFVRSCKMVPSTASASSQLKVQSSVVNTDTGALLEDSKEIEMKGEDEERETSPAPVMMEEDLPVKPRKEWVHMNKMEPEKLEWMRDLPPPRKKGTQKAMQARFDFKGTLIPPTEDLPTHLGLHHHGEEPERAGYSLQELFLLSRSKVISQRSLALMTLANILSKARAGEYRAVLRGSVTSSLLDAGLLFLLRFGLDDAVEGVMSASVRALKALLVCEEDEECLDSTFSWFRGLSTFPMLPSAQGEEDEEDEGLDESLKETPREKEERKTDHDVARQDVVKGLLKMKLLPRFCYILDVLRPSPPVVQDILQVLIRITRHSSLSAAQVLDCPRLMEAVIREFVPTSWTVFSQQSVYGIPLPNAVKLLRVLATSGRHICARLLNCHGVGERLSCLLSAESCELLLAPKEALKMTTEVFRLLAVAAGYGQACNIYIDLYPTIVNQLQSACKTLPPSDPLLPLHLQKTLALLSFITQVTLTGGNHQELHADLVSSQGGDCPPPPPVTWTHVAGLQTSLLGQLKGLLKNLPDPTHRLSSLTLIPAYLLYLDAYFRQLTKQSCFKPVQTLQELEQLTVDVLHPLISHDVVQDLMTNLKSSSIICNDQSSHQDPETLSNLPGLACPGWKDRPGPFSPSSPFPLLTALGLLLETVTNVHKGLSCKFAAYLVAEPVIAYLHCCSQALPKLSHTKAWLLRHEHHFIYVLLSMAHKLVPVDHEVAKLASLYHQMALVLLTWLLPGSEYLAYELLSRVIFNKEFLIEGHSGGPEAVELGELKLKEETCHQPSLQKVGSLLREAVEQLLSIRGCFLTQLAHLEPSVLLSKDSIQGRNPWINSHLLPELTGPSLPSDWPFFPLVSLYEKMGVSDGGGLAVEELPHGALQTVTHCLQWILMLEVWRKEALKVILPVAKLAHLSCIFLCSSDLFLERPVQMLTWGLFRLLTRSSQLDSLDLNIPPSGLASFEDLYCALLTQYEAVSFGDRLFGCWVLLPLQRRYSATMRIAAFGEHVGMLRSLGVTLEQLSIPLERFTSPSEDSIPLLRLYFRSLVTGTLKACWCPVLYAVAVCHVNAFIFSQDAAAQEVQAARHSILRKIYYLTDEVLKNHLLLFRLPQQKSKLGFDMYGQLPPIRAKHLHTVVGQAVKEEKENR